jgi:uncharacterized protein
VIHIGQDKPLTEAELDHLGEFLTRCPGGMALNLEELDGFYCALIVGPENVMPSEYLPIVFGEEFSENSAFDTLERADEILGLLMRHWNSIVSEMLRKDVHIPLLAEDEGGISRGNDWASGFMMGVELAPEAWSDLMQPDDPDSPGYLLPMMILDHENDPEPEMRPQEITPEMREELIVHMAAGIRLIYDYYRAQRTAGADTGQRAARKIGRNETCPCGSGKKYKRCCGGAVVQ